MPCDRCRHGQSLQSPRLQPDAGAPPRPVRTRSRATVASLAAGLRALWRRALDEHSTPGELGASVAVGVLVACTPLVGAHMWIALALATALRLNRLWAVVGSRASFTPIFVWIAFSEIESGHRLRTGAWAPLRPRDALAHGRELLADWALGTAVVGAAMAVCAGLAAFAVARRWQRLPRATRPRPSPDVPRRPSSESPRSAPRSPTP